MVSGTSRGGKELSCIRFILSLKESHLWNVASHVGRAGPGPGNEIEAVDNLPILDLWCYFEIHLKSQRKNSITNTYI